MIRTASVVLLFLALQSAGAPTTDGNVTEQEWTGAQRAKLEGGGEMRLLAQGKFLFVAIRGPRAGLASVCLAKGKTVRILHASAAIGDAAFERWGDMWMKRKAFEWTLRDSRRGPAPADYVKAEWLAKSGWLANASASGSAVREFQIYVKDVESIGVTFLATEDPMSVAYWPSTMDDDCRSIRIPQGYLPDTARFDPTSWHQLSAK
jgi:hypothetical protein